MDPINPGMPMGGMPPPPPPGGPPPMGGPMGTGGEELPHEKILAALSRIEEKLSVIAAKLGA